MDSARERTSFTAGYISDIHFEARRRKIQEGWVALGKLCCVHACGVSTLQLLSVSCTEERITMVDEYRNKI